MKLKIGGAGLGVALALTLGWAAPALADNYAVKDGNGATQSFGSKVISTVHYPIHLLYVLFGGSPVPVNGDASGNLGVNVQSSALPTGGATAANQVTGNGSLASIATNTTGAATAANQTVAQANAGSDASKAIAVQGVTGGKPLPAAVQYGPSGVTSVTPALTSATCSAAFTPIAGRAFNVSGWGTFVATYQLFRSFDAGTTKLPITAAGTVLYQWTAPASETAEETEYGVAYYVCATSYTSGTLNVRISQ